MARLSILLRCLLVASFLSLVNLILCDAVPFLDDEDPFTVPDPGWEKLPLGTILRYRPTPSPISLFSGLDLNMQSSWQILYRTQNSVGLPEANVMTAMVPYAPKTDHLFALSYFTNSAFQRCNPSYALLSKDPWDNFFIHFQTLIAVAALYEGWIVTVADDGGPQSSNPSGLQMGRSTLDSVRAALKSGNFTGLSPKPVTTLHGFSGGALASGWASELRENYAPELDIAGVAIGGLVPNITHFIEHINNGDYTDFVAPSIVALEHDFANFSSWVKDNVSRKYWNSMRRAESQCTVSNIFEYPNMNMDKWFKNGFLSIIRDPVPRSVLDLVGLMGQRGTPKEPWYVYQNVGDQVSKIELVENLIQKHCKNGATIEYEKNLAAADHSTSEWRRYAGAFQWLKERHQRLPVEKGCKNREVHVDSLKSLLPGELQILTNQIMENLGAAGSGGRIQGPNG